MGQNERGLTIILDDGRTVVAQPRPEDQDYLAQLGDSVELSLDPGFDTEAHGISSDIAVDVEGHALTLRLPSAADAQALRRMMMVGAVSATIVAAGAIASLQGSPQANTAQPAAPAAPIAAPAPNLDLSTLREQRLADQDPMWDSQAAGAGSASASEGENPGTHGPGRGALER